MSHDLPLIGSFGAALEPGSSGRDAQNASVRRAAQWTWRLDSGCNVTEIGGARTGPVFAQSSGLLHRPAWQWQAFSVESAKALQSALTQRLRLEGLELSLRDPRGRLTYITVGGEPIYGPDGGFEGYAGRAVDVTERIRAARLLALEQEVGRRLDDATSSRGMLQTVMRIICEFEDWETAGYFRAEDALGTTRLIVGWSGPGMAREAADYYRQTEAKIIPPGGKLSEVIATGQPLWIRSLRSSQTTWSQRVQSTGERATLFFPVKAEGKVLGVFAFASRQLRKPDPALLRSIRLIAQDTGARLRRKQAEEVTTQDPFIGHV